MLILVAIVAGVCGSAFLGAHYGAQIGAKAVAVEVAVKAELAKIKAKL